MLAGDRVLITQSAVVLEKLIGQFMFDRAADAPGAVSRQDFRRKQQCQTSSVPPVPASPALSAALLGGCATTGNPNDPLEGYNRAMFSFNEQVDKVAIKPAAQVYEAVLPSPVRTGVGNVLGNLGDPWIALNNLLQGKFAEGMSDL
jgi:ABC-type transporter lipoprotein component MlaA